jgi:hypothetical protein
MLAIKLLYTIQITIQSKTNNPNGQWQEVILKNDIFINKITIFDLNFFIIKENDRPSTAVSLGPGPSYYEIRTKSISKSSPSATLGIRHSEFCSTLVD